MLSYIVSEQLPSSVHLHRTKSLCLSYILLSANLTSKSTTLYLTCGSAITSKMQNRHCLRRSTSRRTRMLIYSLVELSFALVCRDGIQPFLMRKWYLSPVHSYAHADPRLHKVPRNRTVTYCLHRKEPSPCRKWRKGQGI